VVDDIVTSGTTMRETIDAIREEGGRPVACVVVVDKQGIESIEDVPVYSLIDVVRVGND
jgi:orotate phosphoribosyltransferase